MRNTDKEIFTIIALISLFLILLIAIIILTAILYHNRKRIHKIDLSNFQTILLQSQLEVQEQTLINVSREIHDNITQVLSFIKLNLAMTDGVTENEKQLKINESRDLVAQVINDLRTLSKSLSFEHIKELGLIKTIEAEVNRVNNSRLLNIALTVTGENYSLGEQRELVLFRIFQEALNNTLKHANAKHLKINLQYSKQLFNLILEDDGNGFSPGEIGAGNGSGLKNMQKRAALIGAVTTVSSTIGKGCSIQVTLNPTQQYTYADGNDPNSPG
ncbi:MAG TPA: ATP-binding protein [Mucilaginibacter sp.]